MRRLDLSLPTTAENLALDEALLLCAATIGPTLRFWKAKATTVIVGRGSKIADEVNLGYCKEHDIPVLRRCSGGASIVAGPDCLMYNAVVKWPAAQAIPNVDVAHQYVMSRVLAAVQQQQPSAKLQGICDLTLHEKKFSGNSLRVTREFVLYHGTILQGVDHDLIEACLSSPPRTPDYRGGRSHREFITSIVLNETQFKEDLAANFGATNPLQQIPSETVHKLVAEKYLCDEWNHRH